VSLAAIAGGGTGGHLSIAIAIAQALAEIAPGERILLLGCKMASDEPMLRESGFPFQIIASQPWPRGFRWPDVHRYTWKILAASAPNLWAFCRIVGVLQRERPKVVIGTGGYGSVPAIAAARLLRLPTLIHEADSVPGLGNRSLARFAKIITLGYGEAVGSWCSQRAKVTGNPVRRAFLKTERQEARLSLGISPHQRLILVFGGSQGAQSINQAALGAADSLLDDEEVCLLHISGRRDYKMLQEEMGKLDESRRQRYSLHPFLGEQEMAIALRAADAVVTRGGASALAEIAATGAKAVIIPYPFARQEHQTSNARLLVEKGQGLFLEDKDLSPTSLARAIERIWQARGPNSNKPGDTARSELQGAGPAPNSTEDDSGDAAVEVARLALDLAEARFAMRGAVS
jgi:UDP-N-acetylglucosamine--N-acetylmuramyl-(pentapeptide) pyrophosphoryl-undecaprenol N-acetylglucosamine transferase